MKISAATLLCLWFDAKDVEAKEAYKHYLALLPHQNAEWEACIVLKHPGFQARMVPR